MPTQLTFTEKLSYKDESSGINIGVMLSHGENDIFVSAKVDTGAAVCLFSREAGAELGIEVEHGIPITLDSLGGSVEAFGHEVILQTGELIFQSLVYFAKYPGLPRNLLGRQGWLRNLKLAVIDYDNLLYLNTYNA